MSCNIHLDVFSRLGVVVVGCAWPLKRNFDAFILSAQFLISRQASEQKAETHQEDQSVILPLKSKTPFNFEKQSLLELN